MEPYAADVERAMRLFHESLSEKDRRRYAAVEALKLGHGGAEYVAGVLGCHPRTVRQGRAELAGLPADPAGGRVRKKGAAGVRPSPAAATAGSTRPSTPRS